LFAKLLDATESQDTPPFLKALWEFTKKNSNGLEVEGIFRTEPSLEVVNALEKLIDEGRAATEEDYPKGTTYSETSTLLKRYLRHQVHPEDKTEGLLPLPPASEVEALLKLEVAVAQPQLIAKLGLDKVDASQNVRTALFYIDIGKAVAEKEDKNRMSPSNIGKILFYIFRMPTVVTDMSASLVTHKLAEQLATILVTPTSSSVPKEQDQPRPSRKNRQLKQQRDTDGLNKLRTLHQSKKERPLQADAFPTQPTPDTGSVTLPTAPTVQTHHRSKNQQKDDKDDDDNEEAAADDDDDEVEDE